MQASERICSAESSRLGTAHVRVARHLQQHSWEEAIAIVFTCLRRGARQPAPAPCRASSRVARVSPRAPSLFAYPEGVFVGPAPPLGIPAILRLGHATTRPHFTCTE